MQLDQTSKTALCSFWKENTFFCTESPTLIQSTSVRLKKRSRSCLEKPRLNPAKRDFHKIVLFFPPIMETDEAHKKRNNQQRKTKDSQLNIIKEQICSISTNPNFSSYFLWPQQRKWQAPNRIIICHLTETHLKRVPAPVLALLAYLV